jgi:hypothetical protein
MSGCLEFLNNYADYLSANPNNAAPRPYPFVFSGHDCSGTSYPPTFGSSESEYMDRVVLNPGNINSIYVPPGWVLQIVKGTALPRFFPEKESLFPVLYINNNNDPFFNNVNQIYMNAPRKSTTEFYTISDWKLDKCMNRIRVVVGGKLVKSYSPGSEECDDFMSGFCAVDAKKSCGQESEMKHPECFCLMDENCINDTFCGPNSTNSACNGQDSLATAIPVTCLGKNCSLQGYRFNRMKNRPCNVTLCQQILEASGNEVSLQSKSNLYCGNKKVGKPPSQDNPQPESRKELGPLPTWGWLIIGVIGFILLIALPLAIIIYVRNAKKSKIYTNIKQENMGMENQVW